MQPWETPTPPAIRGEREAGRSRTVRQQLENIREARTTLDWDLATLLHEATENGYFTEWGYPSRKAYVEECLDIKERQVHNLVSIITVQRALGYSREELTPIGTSKLREICSLDLDGTWVNPETGIGEPLVDHIRRLITIAPQLSYDAVLAEVRRLKGLVGENDLTWVNFQVTRIVKDNVVTPGLNAFRQYMGSKNITAPDGSKEYSDGFVLECCMAEVLSGMQQSEEIQDEVTEEI